MFSISYDIDILWLIVMGITIGIAYVVRGVAGFGSALIAIPTLTLITDLSVAVPTVVLLDYLASAGQCVGNRKHVITKEIWLLIPYALIGVGGAIFLLSSFPLIFLGKAMGIFILIYAIYSLMPSSSVKALSRKWAVSAGATGGFAGTLFGTGGPFYAMYLSRRSLNQTEFSSTFSMMFVLDGTVRIAGYLLIGLYNRENLLLIIITIPIMMLGMYIGGRIQTTLPKIAFQRAISVLLIGSGIALMLK